MNEFDEQMLDRDLAEALAGDGPSPDLKQRILEAAGQPKRVTRRPSGRIKPLPVKRTPWGAYVAAAAALLLALGLFGWAINRPQVSDNTDTTPPLTGQQQPAPASNDARKQQPVPKERPPVDEPQPEPGPKETPEPPKPQPQPEPQPQSDPQQEPKPQPQPEPEKPEAVVKKTEPKPDPENPDTEAKPEGRAVVAVVMGEASLKFRVTDSGDWVELNTSEIKQGWQLKAGDAADLRLSNGTRLRFDGEVTIEPGKLVLRGRHTQAYIDALGIDATLAVTRDELGVDRDALKMTLNASEALFDADGSSVEIFCYNGNVKAGENVGAGMRAKLSPRGLSGLRELKASERSPHILKDLRPRSLFDEQFDYCKGGWQSCFGENGCISIKLEQELVIVPGAEVRLRFKASKAGGLYVQFQKEAGEVQWGKWTKLSTDGEWLELTIPFAEFVRDEGHSDAALAVGDSFKTIQVFIQDGAQASLQLDWIDIVRVRP